MKVSLNQGINTLYKRQSTITFCSKPPDESGIDKFESKSDASSLLSKKIQDKIIELRENLKYEFIDKVNLERQGTHIEKIPNCLMLEIKNDGDEVFPVEWMSRVTDCNFVHLTNRNNDTLMDNLDDALKKSKDTFEQTKRRTLIHVEGFDRLITKGQNSFENIDSLKDIMNRSANDFGATIVFSTKDASKLTSEAIQAQRVTLIQVNNSNAELEKYNTLLESHGYFKDYEKRIASNPADVPRPEIKKDTTEVPSKQVEQPKPKTETKKPEIQIEQHESGKISDTSDVSTPKRTESSKSNVSGSDTPPPRQTSEQKSSAKTTSSPIGTKKEAEIKPPKTPDVTPPVKKVAEKASDGPKAFKIIAIFVAIGAAIAGVIYFAKNKNQQVKEKSSKSNNITIK